MSSGIRAITLRVVFDSFSQNLVNSAYVHSGLLPAASSMPRWQPRRQEGSLRYSTVP